MAVHAESSIQLNTIPANTSLLGGHFLYKSSNTVKQGVITTTTGAGVIQNLDSDPANWGYNTWIGSNSIQLRYGETADATLSTNGLVLSKGGINAKEGSSDFVYLSSEDYPLRQFQLTQDITLDPEKTYYIIDENNQYTEVEEPDIADINTYYEIEVPGITINDYTPMQGGIPALNDPAWRQVIGTKFGVDSEGNLYAANANISGAINATSGSISSSVEIAYITKIGNDGIRIHPASDIDNSILLNSSGMEIFQNGTATTDSVAFYGSTARIGKTSGYNTFIDSNGINLRTGTTSIANFGSTIRLGQLNEPHLFFTQTSTATQYPGLEFYLSSTELLGGLVSTTWQSIIKGIALYGPASSGTYLGIYNGFVYISKYLTVDSYIKASSYIETSSYIKASNYIETSSYIESINSTNHEGIRLVASSGSSGYKGVYDSTHSSWIWCLKYGETDRYRTAGHIMPNSDNDLYMGLANNRWKAVYAANGTIQTSDIKAKDILGTIDYAEDLIMGLEPVDFMWKDGDHRRKRMGFKAQQSAQLCKELNQNLAFVTATYKEDDDLPYYGEDVDDELLNWGMVKEELIAPLVKVVQNQQKEIQKLKTQVQNLSLMIQGE